MYWVSPFGIVHSIATLHVNKSCIIALVNLFSLCRAGPLIALFLTAIACGNIKPCLAAFGGDQFDQKEASPQIKKPSCYQLALFLSVLKFFT